MKKWILVSLAVFFLAGPALAQPRVIVTSDGEVDDECSLVRFLLYANEWDVEGIVTSSSQYHWRGHNWAGDDWTEPYLDAYEEVYPNLVSTTAGIPRRSTCASAPSSEMWTQRVIWPSPRPARS